MLLWFGPFIVMNERDHVILPLSRPVVALVRNLIQDIVKIVHCIDYLAYVGFLKSGNLWNEQRMGLPPLTIAIGVAINSIYVICPVKGMAFPGIVGIPHRGVKTYCDI